MQSWDRFHSDYNAWRADDGGCDRLEVLESLTEFSANVDAVGDSVRSLPKSGYLEPVHRLLVEAIAGEEQAFRSLRDTWQPFTLDALRAVDRARMMSDTRPRRCRHHHPGVGKPLLIPNPVRCNHALRPFLLPHEVRRFAR